MTLNLTLLVTQISFAVNKKDAQELLEVCPRGIRVKSEAYGLG